MELRIVTPEENMYFSEIDSAVVKTGAGPIIFRKRFTPFVCNVLEGELKIRLADREILIVTSSGFAEVMKNTLTLICDFAMPKSEDEDTFALIKEKQKTEEAKRVHSLDASKRAEIILKRNI
ncbi:MAG: hypothetical protein FWF50_03405 [Defluviitaleaceae bacterium]|nr:hypothetical protein [Defluviitaleaceae bacterium]